MKEMSDKEQLQIIEDFVSKMINSQKDVESEFLDVLDDNFWELIENENENI